MYYPYFRGKQYELITIRENVELLQGSGFIPIIEPVKESLSGLTRTLSAVADVDGEAIVIVNPYHGEHSGSAEGIISLIRDDYEHYDNISPGVLLTEDMEINDIRQICDHFDDRNVALIHSGFAKAKSLAASLDGVLDMTHVFVEDNCGKLYRKHFLGSKRVLLRDGFEKRINREHPEIEFFSDLHATYGEEGMDGFGDFLIVGSDYSEGGGPAYAVAIHITFIDPDNDDEMHIHHFISDRQDDPKDPAGKFYEALEKLVNEVNSTGSKVLKTNAVKEFIELYNREHFPGLGYVKKLSMQHHVETLANYFE